MCVKVLTIDYFWEKLQTFLCLYSALPVGLRFDYWRVETSGVATRRGRWVGTPFVANVTSYLVAFI